MFRICFLLCALLSPSFAEDLIDVISMKNGDVYRGRITEQQLNNFIEMRFDNGDKKRILWKEVKNVKRESSTKEHFESSPDAPPPIDPILDTSDAQPKTPLNIYQKPTTSHRGSSIRISGGITSSTLSTTSNFDGYSSGIGFRVAVLNESRIDETISIMSGLEFIKRQIDLSINSDLIVGDGDVSLNYLVVPLLLRGVYQNFSIGIGPYLGFPISAKITFEGSKTDVLDEVASIDIGGRVYSTIDFSDENGVFVGFGYDLGFSNINSTGSIKERNRTLFIDLGVAI